MNNNGFSNTSVLASNLFANHATVEESGANKRLLSRFGCYLMLSLVNPSEFGEIVNKFILDLDLHNNCLFVFIFKEIFGKILGMTLQWFHLVCHVPSDSSAELIAKLRTQVTFIYFDRNRIESARFLFHLLTFSTFCHGLKERLSIISNWLSLVYFLLRPNSPKSVAFGRPSRTSRSNSKRNLTNLAILSLTKLLI